LTWHNKGHAHSGTSPQWHKPTVAQTHMGTSPQGHLSFQSLNEHQE